MAGFTKGPWVIRKYEAAFWVVSGEGIKIVNTSWHDAIRNPYPLKSEALANCHLIASAPALYGRLTNALHQLQHLQAFPENTRDAGTANLIELIEADLKAARGETPPQDKVEG